MLSFVVSLGKGLFQTFPSFSGLSQDFFADILADTVGFIDAIATVANSVIDPGQGKFQIGLLGTHKGHGRCFAVDVQKWDVRMLVG